MSESVYNERAEKILSEMIAKGKENYMNSQGRQMGFEIRRGMERTNKDLMEYCIQWYPLSQKDQDKNVEGWKAHWSGDYEDKSGISLGSHGSYVKVIGKCESVKALTVVGCAFAAGIPFDAASKCPSSAPFWNHLERGIRDVGHPDLPRRPPGAKQAVSATNPWGFDYSQDKHAVTSPCVKNYVKVLWNAKMKEMVREAKDELEVREMTYKQWSFNDACVALTKKCDNVSYDGGAYIRIDFDFGMRVRTGEMIAYCKKLWYDGIVDKLGIRWRTSNAEKGGVYLPDQDGKAIACMASKRINLAMKPIMAAIALRIKPEMARSCRAMQDFWSFVNWDWRNEMPEPISEYKDAVRKQLKWNEDANLVSEEYSEDLYYIEEEALNDMMMSVKSEYSRTKGQWCGGDCIPGVSYSRDYFVEQVMTWWPYGECQEVGRFRYKMDMMDKGGLKLELGGKNASVQSKQDWAEGLMCILCAIMCGIPVEIASLCAASNPFWEMIETHVGLDEVRRHRSRLRTQRNQKFGGAWKEKRLQETERLSAGNRERNREAMTSHPSQSSQQAPQVASYEEYPSASKQSSYSSQDAANMYSQTYSETIWEDKKYSNWKEGPQQEGPHDYYQRWGSRGQDGGYAGYGYGGGSSDTRDDAMTSAWYSAKSTYEPSEWTSSYVTQQSKLTVEGLGKEAIVLVEKHLRETEDGFFLGTFANFNITNSGLFREILESFWEWDMRKEDESYQAKLKNVGTNIYLNISSWDNEIFVRTSSSREMKSIIPVVVCLKFGEKASSEFYKYTKGFYDMIAYFTDDAAVERHWKKCYGIPYPGTRSSSTERVQPKDKEEAAVEDTSGISFFGSGESPLVYGKLDRERPKQPFEVDGKFVMLAKWTCSDGKGGEQPSLEKGEVVIVDSKSVDTWNNSCEGFRLNAGILKRASFRTDSLQACDRVETQNSLLDWLIANLLKGRITSKLNWGETVYELIQCRILTNLGKVIEEGKKDEQWQGGSWTGPSSTRGDHG